MRSTQLTPELRRLQRITENHARELGLDFFPVHFELLDWNEINAVAAYTGIPSRYPHWRFGMEYDRLAKGATYGLQKIYELVINSNPSYAYLMRSNSIVDQKLVMAHVYGHVDFFKNNMWFSKTNRKMVDEMANHGTRIRKYIDRFGIEVVEDFLDRCLSIEDLIDPYAPFGERARTSPPDARRTALEEKIHRFESKGYMARFLNPPEYIESQRESLREEEERQKRFPEQPERDVHQILNDHAPLEPWQVDILSIVREEAYYFAPQRMTKIMNEGWACVTGDTLVYTDLGLITMRELVERGEGAVYDGERRQRVYDVNVIRDHETVTVTTRRGFRLTGSTNHRILLADHETWRRLDELRIGDRVAISGGGGLAPPEVEPVDPGRAFAALAVQAARQVIVRVGVEREIAVLERRSRVAGQAIGRVPGSVLRSPVEGAGIYLRALFDAAGVVEDADLVLPGLTERSAREIQLLLLNHGVLSACSSEGGWHIRIQGSSVLAFEDGIGREEPLDQVALRRPIEPEASRRKPWEDEVVALERGREDVYDVSVTGSHRYVAAGFVNHNSYWHSTLMTTKLLKDSELIDYADHHSGTMGAQPGVVNPYKVGIELFRDIEERWNKGRFGKEYDECDDLAAKRRWDTGLGKGREKIFEVRRIYNDVSFIETFLTEEFCHQHKLFVYRFNPRTGQYEIDNRDFALIKSQFLFMLTNSGLPRLEVVDANHRNRGELFLSHRHEGIDLQLDLARDSLANVQRIWNRPVHLQTTVDGQGKILSFDGREHIETDTDLIEL